MIEQVIYSNVPVPEDVLRDLAKNVAQVSAQLAILDTASGMKEIHKIIDPVLETVDQEQLQHRHRAAACNALCAIIESFYSLDIGYIRSAILDDWIWTRVFEIFLKRSDEAKGKSMRQLLMVLTSVITKYSSPREFELQTRATEMFLDVMCERQDRVKVKPALQGLAHFLLCDVISIEKLIQLHAEVQPRPGNAHSGLTDSQFLFMSILTWAVHHDTALSAGHLVKNFLLRARLLPSCGTETKESVEFPSWIEPVVLTLRDWPDRIQYFQTHIFPHCFLPDITAYTQFLLYLHLDVHVESKVVFRNQFHGFEIRHNGLTQYEEFKFLLAAIETGKEQRILRDNGTCNIQAAAGSFSSTDSFTNCQDSRLCSELQIRDDVILLPDDLFGSWMAYSEPEARLAGVFLSVYSVSITKPITGGIFQSLKRNFDHLHTNTDTNFRREVHGYTHKLFDRLRASTATLVKGKSKTLVSYQSQLIIPEHLQQKILYPKHLEHDPLAEALAFIVWYLRFIEWQMRPTASYQRCVTALRSLSIVLRSGLDPDVQHSQLSKSAQGQLNWAHQLQIATPKVIRVLFDQILDPFDDVRDAAISLLRLCLETLPGEQKTAIMTTIPRFLSRAERLMLQTGRADQADGVARAYGLIFALASDGFKSPRTSELSSKLSLFKHLSEQLNTTLILARTNLVEAVQGRPIHGIYASLRYIVDQADFYQNIVVAPQETFKEWKRLHTEVIASLEPLWSNVYPTLCADAPEGFVPDNLEDEASVDTKEVSSYSWRGLKEASTLLRIIISKCPIGNDDHSMIDPEQFEKLASLCFAQLLELRHRGAFSTVSHTFAAFCRRCSASSIPELRALPKKWYGEILRAMHDKAGAITRRSAGIPALMSGVLAADCQPGGNLLSRAMDDLVAETTAVAENRNIEESRLPQVHALNCIKEIFTSSGLSIASEAYIGQGLELAAKTLNSSVWPIRNCGLMLFKALIERLLGEEAQDWKVRERSKTSRFSYYDYPSLANILSGLLDPNGPLKQSSQVDIDGGSPFDLHGAEGVFPALQILRQARPPEKILKLILPDVEFLLGSPHWHLRDMAARTIVSMRFKSQLYEASLVQLRVLPRSENTKHGILLTAKYTIQDLFKDLQYLKPYEFGNLINKLRDHSLEWYYESASPFVRSTFLDIVNQCGIAMLQRPDLLSITDSWKDLAASVSIGPEYDLDVEGDRGNTDFMISLTRSFVIDRIIMLHHPQHNVRSSEQQSIGDALQRLAQQDPDICCAALETLDNMVQLQSTGISVASSSFILANVTEHILFATEPEIISKAQVLLADALADGKQRHEYFSQLAEEQVMSMLLKLEAQCLNGSPSNMQKALHLLAFVLDFAYQACSNHHRNTLMAISRFIRILRAAIVDTNPFDIRFTAVQSICALQNIWAASTKSKSTGPLLLGLSLVLYDLLNDDDDEIREAAASATAHLLRAQVDADLKDTVPLLSAHYLAGFLCTAFCGSSNLIREATRRVTKTPSPTPLFHPSFAERFAAARQVDTALFASEKQNLYIDETLEAVLWSRVLSRQPVQFIPQTLRSNLAKWVLDSLAVLMQTAKTEVDGPLGWTSKDEVFAHGMQVFCAAEVVLKWEEHGNWKLGSVRSEVLKALRLFVDVGHQAEVHPLWLERVEQVLEKQVVRTMKSMRRRLLAIQ